MFYRPSPFFIVGANKQPLTVPVMPIFGKTPRGADWRLDYILIAYNRVVVAGVQTSPELFFMLFDSRGVSLTSQPVPIRDVTTPGGSPRGVHGVSKWGVVYPPSTVIKMDITGQVGTGPETISVTFMGQQAPRGR